MSDDVELSILAPFRAAPGVLIDGQKTLLRVNASGALVVVGGGGGGVVVVVAAPPLSFDTGGTLADSDVIRASPGTLLDINGFNNSANTRFFMMFNTVAVPADTAVPVTIVIRVQRMSLFSVSFADSQGRLFDTGISWASSSTNFALTRTLAADMLINAQHRDP
ncbi:hypothetical protein LCGC14_1022840 [marine sediment metagenome]|uniref:Uncharacterized protein n=1 Tax=marine sediment metagenome TaxID=412755 RepID=A0A0F9MX08_9ZZZZ